MLRNTGDSPDASTIVSRSPGKAYDRMRQARPSHFTGPLARKLLVAGGLLAVLAATFAPAVLRGLAPGMGAGTAPSPEAVALGTAAAALVATGALAHAAVGAYRYAFEPLTERQALRLVVVEDAGAYLGLLTGGLLVLATVGAVALTGDAATGGEAAASGPGLALLTGATALGGVLAVAAGRLLRGRLPDS